MCSRASLGNWNMWVRGVQEDPLGPIAVRQQRNGPHASGNTCTLLWLPSICLVPVDIPVDADVVGRYVLVRELRTVACSA